LTFKARSFAGGRAHRAPALTEEARMVSYRLLEAPDFIVPPGLATDTFETGRIRIEAPIDSTRFSIENKLWFHRSP
jgi:hypothetical protein